MVRAVSGIRDRPEAEYRKEEASHSIQPRRKHIRNLWSARSAGAKCALGSRGQATSIVLVHDDGFVGARQAIEVELAIEASGSADGR